FIFGHPVIGFVILSIAAGTFAISAFGSLIAVYVRDVLHANSYLFGALGSAIGAGMLAGGLVVTPLARRIQQKAYLSEEHTSELQSLTNLGCRLLLEKKTT